MKPEFDDVLLTAYLDDEVTDAERASVEEQLRKSEASRKLLEELRSVRNLVVQLHLTQPSRGFQRGPWNETESPEARQELHSMDAPKVVLIASSWYRRLPLNRLASLAAVIAIAICASVLWIRQNGQAVRLSDLSSRSNLSLPASNEPRSMPAAGRTAGEAKLDTMEFRTGDAAKPAHDNALFYQAPGGAPPAPESRVASESPRGVMLPPIPSDPMPPASAVPAPAVARALERSKSKELRSELGTAALAEKSVSEMDGVSEFFMQSSEGFVKLDNSGALKSNDYSGELIFRYGTGQPKDNPVALSLAENEFVEADKQKNNVSLGIESRPMLVEFQVPIENWELGAKQLRKLGIDLPDEVPTGEYLEFNAIPIVAANRYLGETDAEGLNRNGFGLGKQAASASRFSSWRFQPVAPQRKETQPAIETGAKESSVKDEKENRPSTEAIRTEAIRIRVRAIKP